MNNDRNELLHNAMKPYKADYKLSEIDYDATSGTYKITEKIAAIAKQTLEEALEMSIEAFMNEENISALIVFDRNFVRELIKMYDPTPPVKNWFNEPICPHCQSAVDKVHDKKYCGRCGQRLDWKN